VGKNGKESMGQEAATNGEKDRKTREGRGADGKEK